MPNGLDSPPRQLRGETHEDRPDADDAYGQLRTVLLHEEHERLAQLEARLNDAARRAEELSAVLPRAMARTGDEALAGALTGAVGRCISESVRHNPDLYADALYPVMGPSIRRSITAAFRNMVQSISQTVDASLSPRSVSWRITAWRTGIPFNELVLRHTLRFRVEQVFLVQPGSGLLIAHAAREDTITAESDAVSAMLSAIQDFVGDSFLQENHGQKLDSVEFGDYNIWLVHGPNAVLAAVIRGFAPEDVREQFVVLLEALHRDFEAQLMAFDGDRTATEHMVPALAQCLFEELRTPARAGIPRSAKLAFAAFALLALAGVGYWLYSEQQLERRISALENAITAEPGLVLTSISRDGRQLQVRGLRDPLAADPAGIARQMGFVEGKDLTSRWDSYQAIHPLLTRQRALAVLAPPPSVQVTFDGTTLGLSGSASAKWIERAQLVAVAIPGIASIDLSRLLDEDTLFAQTVRDALDAPDPLEVAISGRDVRISGPAPVAWLPRLAQLRETVPEIGELDVRAVTLAPASLAPMRQLLAARTVYFEDGVTLASAPAQLDEVATSVLELARTVGLIGVRVRLRILGSTDGVGSRASNMALAVQRAQRVRELLVERGVPASWLTPGVGSIDESGGDANAADRKADFELNVTR